MTRPLARVGVVGTSAKPHERRVPLHPAHLPALPGPVRERLVFERGYGEPFGWPDEALAALVGGLAPRAALLSELDGLILLKPEPADLAAMCEGAVHWGWPHAVQQHAVAEAAIARRLTLIAFEAMNEADGRHTFEANNVMAGHAAVTHALAAAGMGGPIGPPLKAVVLGLGAVGRGAVAALRALGRVEVTACVQASEAVPADVAEGLAIVRVRRDPADPGRMVEGDRPLLARLAEADLVVNAIRQDPAAPVMFVTTAELPRLRPGCLVIDVSCDAGMGFGWAAPTSFAAPLRELSGRAYYAVDHTPSWWWADASWAISEALVPHLPAFLAGPAGWAASPVLAGAVVVAGGVVHDPAILAFQGREAAWPHGYNAARAGGPA